MARSIYSNSSRRSSRRRRGGGRISFAEQVRRATQSALDRYLARQGNQGNSARSSQAGSVQSGRSRRSGRRRSGPSGPNVSTNDRIAQWVQRSATTRRTPAPSLSNFSIPSNLSISVGNTGTGISGHSISGAWTEVDSAVSWTHVDKKTAVKSSPYMLYWHTTGLSTAKDTDKCVGVELFLDVPDFAGRVAGNFKVLCLNANQTSEHEQVKTSSDVYQFKYGEAPNSKFFAFPEEWYDRPLTAPAPMLVISFYKGWIDPAFTDTDVLFSAKVTWKLLRQV